MAMVTGLFVMAAAAGTGTGCAASDPAKAFDGNATYVAEADQAKAQEIGNRMWATMTAAPCWYMKGSTTNYSFSGYLQYRYAGYETTSGQLGVSSVGKYGEYDAADVMIGGTQYWIGVYDSQTLVIGSINNGGLVTNVYIAVGPGGQCV